MTRGFKEVADWAKRTEGKVTLPTRATSGAMAYDFYANTNYTVRPNDIAKIWTDVKAIMPKGEGLIINIRSSMGGELNLINQQGWIDSDYADNETTDGNIGFFLKNVSEKSITILKGQRIGQGMFINYLLTDDDKPLSDVRKGGFGSTNE